MNSHKVFLTRSFPLRGMHWLKSEPCLHGHDYQLEVTVSGNVDDESGMILSRDQIQSVVYEHIVKKFDKRRWNDLIPNTSGEYLTVYFKKLLLDSPLAPFLVSVSLQETEKNRFPGLV